MLEKLHFCLLNEKATETLLVHLRFTNISLIKKENPEYVTPDTKGIMIVISLVLK